MMFSLIYMNSQPTSFEEIKEKIGTNSGLTHHQKQDYVYFYERINKFALRLAELDSDLKKNQIHIKDWLGRVKLVALTDKVLNDKQKFLSKKADKAYKAYDKIVSYPEAVQGSYLLPYISEFLVAVCDKSINPSEKSIDFYNAKANIFSQRILADQARIKAEAEKVKPVQEERTISPPKPQPDNTDVPKANTDAPAARPDNTDAPAAQPDNTDAPAAQPGQRSVNQIAEEVSNVSVSIFDYIKSFFQSAWEWTMHTITYIGDVFRKLGSDLAG